MPNDRRIIDRLRAENMVLRALVIELGGTPPVAPPVDAAGGKGPPLRLPTLTHLAQRGL